MSVVNPVRVRDTLTNDAIPAPLLGEVFILRRENTRADIKSPKYGKLSGEGTFFVTNIRFVFLCTGKPSPGTFTAYETKLNSILDEGFEQPIFGANYLRGSSAPDFPGAYPDDWRIVFPSGGCGTLLPVLVDLLTRARANHQEVYGTGSTHPVVIPANAVGYVDPSDPSVIYVQQPRPSISGAD